MTDSIDRLVGDRAEYSGAVRVRAMTPADLSAVTRVEQACFSDPWSETAFADLLTHPHVHALVATLPDGAVVGHCITLRMADEAEVANLAVVPDQRRTGIGATLLGRALALGDQEGVQATFLEVRESNMAAGALYAASGFRPVGRRRRYYRSPEEDALLLRRDRPPAA